MKNKNNIGITLIALIITIIVLLILAGVTITLVIGDNGVIKRSQDAKVKHVLSSIREQVEMGISDVLAENLADSTKVIISSVVESIRKGNSSPNTNSEINGI